MIYSPFELPQGTPLHWAAFARNQLAMEALLELGADIDSTYHALDASTTPLALAIWAGDVEVVKFLLLNGANGRLKDSKGRNCLHFMTLYRPDRHGSLTHHWHYWIRHGNWDEHQRRMAELVKLVAEAGADVEAGYERYPQYTPIIEASELGVWDGGAICALLSLGADVANAKGVSGDSGNNSYKLFVSFLVLLTDSDESFTHGYPLRRHVLTTRSHIYMSLNGPQRKQRTLICVICTLKKRHFMFLLQYTIQKKLLKTPVVYYSAVTNRLI